MLNRFIQFFKEKNLLHQQNHFIVTTSGGVDSAVLCELCYQAKFSFSIAHCNFKLRGEESDRDENFVRSLGQKYKVNVLVETFETEVIATEKKISVQEAARLLRYSWFKDLAEKETHTFVLLAHHANDDIETVIMNFFRGTGLEGLTGMKWNLSESHCLRPLLTFNRKQIKDFARNNNLNWVEDSTNRSNKYTRNFFRNEIIPLVKKVFPQAEENVLNNIQRFKKSKKLYDLLVADLKKKLNKGSHPEVRIPVKLLMSYRHTSLIYEIIKDYGFGEKQVHEIEKLAESESGKFIENESYQIIKHRHWFIISLKFEKSNTIAIEEGIKQIGFEGGLFEIKTMALKNTTLSANQTRALVDAKEIEYPLVLRLWKEGDYFYPLGMQKKKKLSRFFIDKKLPKNEKEKIWVIESAKRIVWIVGKRIDDRFKITDKTQKVIQFTISSP
ncbi:MAG: tRNA lysidine(34) synthetase TilS [Chitinophagaceae bacterium]